MQAARAGPATLVYIGTYTNTTSKGIYLFRLQPTGSEVFQNVTLVPLGVAAEAKDPSFLQLDIKRRLLFCVNETLEFEGKPTGAVSSYAIDPAGKLALLSRRSSTGPGPCHLALDKTGRHLVVANYEGGSVAIFPVAADGKLGEASDVIEHSGRSVHPERQTAPHAHCVTFDPANRYAFVCDLGIDKVVAYKLDAENGKLIPHEAGTVSVKPGAGPRHMAFRPDGKFAYVTNELDSTVNAYSYDAGAGKLTRIQTVSTVPGYYDGPNSTAEIAVHPTGKYLFVSNRGHNSVALFTIDAAKGELNWVEEQGTGGKTPRHFGLEPNGAHMAICNQESDTVLASRIDASNGRLKPSGIFAEVPSPVCAAFLPPAEKA